MLVPSFVDFDGLVGLDVAGSLQISDLVGERPVDVEVAEQVEKEGAVLPPAGAGGVGGEGQVEIPQQGAAPPRAAAQIVHGVEGQHCLGIHALLLQGAAQSAPVAEQMVPVGEARRGGGGHAGRLSMALFQVGQLHGR